MKILNMWEFSIDQNGKYIVESGIFTQYVCFICQLIGKCIPRQILAYFIYKPYTNKTISP